MIALSIIIVNWNTKNLLINCIDSIYSNTSMPLEIIVVDNGSADGSVEAVYEKYSDVKVISNNKNLGFARANNRAIRQMKGQYAVLLNSDTYIKDGALERMYEFMQNTPDAGICGPQLLNGDGSLQSSYGSFPSPLADFLCGGFAAFLAPDRYCGGFLKNRNKIKDNIKPMGRTDTGITSDNKNNIQAGYGGASLAVDFIIGACMMVRKEAIDKVGMLDEEYFFFYEEIDWCWRMNKAGWLVYNLPAEEIYHFGGSSTKDVSLKARAESWRSRYIFFKKIGHSIFGIYILGFAWVFANFLGVTLSNVLTLFFIKRLRRRWIILGYLLLWHLRGFPVSMCLPRFS